ncbi:MAG: UDP-N-acetylmuramoyl-L-alanyl-D-glutamate--2,6-diaminopimelate ligase [Nocardioidaceae bacterium]
MRSALGAASPAVSPDEIAVTGLSLSSGTIRPGDLYAALPGARTHGARFAREAVSSGATAVLTDPTGVDLAGGVGVPVVVVADPRAVLGAVAALVYGNPAADLTLIGITGTQGKTTTSYLVNAGLAAAGTSTAIVGTMGTWIGGRPVGSTLTTPEAPDLHALFAVMREEGVQTCVMEVSSHALVLGRVDGVRYDLAVFTNFGRDHLDFHHTVEEYFAAKASLFTPERSRRALLNVDDPAVARLAADPRVPTATFSPSGTAADWTCRGVEMSATGSTFVVTGPAATSVPAAVRLAGRFNVANALCALAAIGEIGGEVSAGAAGIASYLAVAGRMERIDRGQPFAVLVDYAHKPDAVAATLGALRPVTEGRLTIVLGAGGDRDAGKRPLMGEIAARLADVLVVTDDNPRSEDPAAIRRAVIAGVPADAGATVLEIGDRYTAIRTALAAARPGDTVVIAGKGHETGQYVGDEVLAFDDRAVAAEILDQLAASGAAS